MPYNQGLVFATQARALYVAQIHKAIRKARTGGEFRSLMPRAEYSRVMRYWFDYDGDRRPNSHESFSGDRVPGVPDGDYPRWLQPEMGDILPPDLLRRFGKRADTALNGSFTFIPPANAQAMIRALKALGYRVRSGTRLPFW